MKIITNHKMIKNRSRIAQFTTLGSLALVILGMVLVFRDGMLLYSSLAMILAVLLMQIGVFMGNRWGSKIHPDKAINAALKGLDNKYTLYHYMTSVPHFLIGPAGIFHIITYHQGGQITFDESKNRWKQKGGNAYLKIFAQEGLGRPDLDIEAFNGDLAKFIEKKMPALKGVQPEPILLFLNEKATVDAKNASAPTLTPDKLKDFFRSRAKAKPADMQLIEQVASQLPTEDIE